MSYMITTTGTGGSQEIDLPPLGDFHLSVKWAGSAGDADLQINCGAGWIDVEDSSGVVNITADKVIRVGGGARYRLDVNTHTSAATLLATQIEA